VALAKTHSSHKEKIIRHISDLIEVTDDIPFASLIADDLAAFQDRSVLPVLKKAFRDGRINNLFIHEDDIESIITGDTIFEMERYTVDPLAHFSRENMDDLYIEYYVDNEDEDMGGVDVFLFDHVCDLGSDGCGLACACEDQLGGWVCLIEGSWRGFRQGRREFNVMDTTFLIIKSSFIILVIHPFQ